MPSLQEETHPDGLRVLSLESDFLKVQVAPELGGRVTSVVEKRSGHEFLWRNRRLRLQPLPSGSDYDPNFYGGIDELLPNDIPEEIDGIACPDHGELWTTALTWHAEGERLVLEGILPRFGLRYRREMSLASESPRIEFSYTITNQTAKLRRFLWKLHAALAIQPGDVIECPARKARVVDLAWSRRKTLVPFDWPRIEGQAANVVPEADGTLDFFYLYQLSDGCAGWRRPSRNLAFVYEFDGAVFPFVWLFASYGGFDSHFTAILEPCTAMPISVNEAAARNQCSVLQPGQKLQTKVTLYAGPPGGT